MLTHTQQVNVQRKLKVLNQDYLIENNGKKHTHTLHSLNENKNESKNKAAVSKSVSKSLQDRKQQQQQNRKKQNKTDKKIKIKIGKQSWKWWKRLNIQTNTFIEDNN